MPSAPPSDLPVIVSLEVHACLEQQAIMVEIMKEVWHNYLIDENSPPACDPEVCQPTPGQLRRKFLVKVKYVSPENAVQKNQQEQQSNAGVTGSGEGVPATKVVSESDEDGATVQTGTEDTDGKKKKPRKILDALGRLGIYTRSYHFSALTQPGRSSDLFTCSHQLSSRCPSTNVL
jgi:hypothetical protein